MSSSKATSLSLLAKVGLAQKHKVTGHQARRAEGSKPKQRIRKLHKLSRQHLGKLLCQDGDRVRASACP